MISKKSLIDIGFADKEASVYLALLELGPSTVSEIGRLAQINRTTGYDILELLAGKGLVNVLEKGAVKKYAVEDPQKIIVYSQNKIQRAEKEFGIIKNLLPELRSIYNKKEKPKVKFYEGKEGLKQVYEDTLTAKEPLILGYSCAEPMYQSLPNFFPDYLKRRVAKKIHGKMIAPDTPGIREMIKTDKADLRESRIVPKEQLNLAIEINIYDNKVMIASWEENLGILIESDKIADAQKKIFELAWRGARKFKKQ